MLRARFLHLIMSHAWAGNRTRVGGVTGERANHYTTAPLCSNEHQVRDDGTMDDDYLMLIVRQDMYY